MSQPVLNPKTCAKCGSRGTCYNSRSGYESDYINKAGVKKKYESKYPYIRRRYKCLKDGCKNRWTTFEVREEHTERIEEKEKTDDNPS